ncbi:MAG: UTP--glucose-1-phosphate uridylyltransferase [Coxiellaceae bacterium]|nr:UTP--glucose-1-phosphate uridylyltransferase [Coxiellaceae bacterium]
MSSVKTAVFPVGGLGTRFLPATKASPKEMLPIVDKPIIQYVVEEAIDAGIEQLIFVTSHTKRAIEDYFDTNYELESRLELAGKLDVLSRVKQIVPKGVDFLYVRQPAPLGLGDAVLRAKHAIGDKPFSVLLADDIIDSPSQSCLSQMVNVFDQTHSSVVAVETVPKEDTDKYGIVSLAGGNLIKGIIEKPSPEQSPSNLAVVGRYIFTPEIFDYLQSIPVGNGGELQLTDAIAAMLSSQDVYAHAFTGTRFDCGSRLGMMKATMNYAFKDESLRATLQSYLAELDLSIS